MNVQPAPAALLPDPPPAPPRPSLPRRFADIMLGKIVTLVLAAVALVLGIATFVVLANGVPFAVDPNLAFGLVLSNLFVLLLLGAVLAGRLTRVWVERRRGSAGARLHVRLVVLFSVVAVTPTIVVAILATAFFNLGIQAWFSDRVRTALEDSLQASQGYLDEHRNNITSDALGMANDLARMGPMLIDNPDAYANVLATQTALRGLTQAVVFEPITGQVITSAGAMAGFGTERAPQQMIDQAMSGGVAVFDSSDGTRVRAVVRLAAGPDPLNAAPDLMLLIERPVDPQILSYAAHTQQAVAQYERLDQNRSALQISFALIFAMVALLVLSAAVLIGLVLANQIARPIGRLILAADRVRAGDLAVRVPEVQSGDEVAGLSRAFNRMTGQLAAQRAELMDAYSQIDARRRFTETVLAGVSAGVIGLDDAARIELPNRAAGELLGCDLLAAIGHELVEVVPEFGALLRQAREQRGAFTAEVQIGPASRRRTLLVRIGTELKGERPDGYVVTFDDITELEQAQRKAAWADVARRIAHEIKNPLTPIQLSAERLKRKFAREITSDPETFTQCADTIVRHVGDIGRMVDEFSAFARMPQPVIRPDDVGRLAREALILQRNAHPEIAWATDIPERGPLAACDRRQIGQALTNLLQNAADAVAMRPGAGHIAIGVAESPGEVRISVCDDGVGLPQGDRARLTEPYVTHKPKGTGLGLAIVKKIMEDHGGDLVLEDRVDGPGTIASLVLPARPASPAQSTGQGTGQKTGEKTGQSAGQDTHQGASA
jgi:two-component system nitrogen regulation sensor histidine kinase NtrY